MQYLPLFYVVERKTMGKKASKLFQMTISIGFTMVLLQNRLFVWFRLVLLAVVFILCVVVLRLYRLKVTQLVKRQLFTSFRLLSDTMNLDDG